MGGACGSMDESSESSSSVSVPIVWSESESKQMTSEDLNTRSSHSGENLTRGMGLLIILGDGVGFALL